LMVAVKDFPLYIGRGPQETKGFTRRGFSWENRGTDGTFSHVNVPSVPKISRIFRKQIPRSV
jgi:hypothetical protein